MKLCVRAPWLSFSFLLPWLPLSPPLLHASLCSFVTFIFSSCRILYNLVLPNIPPNACDCACFRLCGYSRCPKLWTSIWEHSMCCRKLLYGNPSASTPFIPSISLIHFSPHHQTFAKTFSPHQAPNTAGVTPTSLTAIPQTAWKPFPAPVPAVPRAPVSLRPRWKPPPPKTPRPLPTSLPSQTSMSAVARPEAWAAPVREPMGISTGAVRATDIAARKTTYYLPCPPSTPKKVQPC